MSYRQWRPSGEFKLALILRLTGKDRHEQEVPRSGKLTYVSKSSFVQASSLVWLR